jgi:hypothetical protein
MSALSRHSTRVSVSSRGENLLVPLSIASALVAAGIALLIKPVRRRRGDVTAIKGLAKDDVTVATVVTRTNSREGEPSSPVAAAQLDGTPIMMEVNTAVQQEEISLQGLQGKKFEVCC